MKILVIGESCTDIFHYGESSRLCPEGPVPVFNSIDIIKNSGMAKNVESNLRAFGSNVDIITNDNWETITKTRFVDLNSNHMFLRVDKYDDQFGELQKSTIDKINFIDYDAVIVSDYNKGFLSETMMTWIATLHEKVFLDTKKILGEWCNDFAFIKINNKEYEATKHTISGILSKKTIRTRGPIGSTLLSKTYKVPTVEVKDTSGAGDTFISALCYKFVETNDIHKSIAFANECSTKVVQKRGVSTV